MEVTLALLCDAANVTADGKLNILGVLNRVAVPEFPAVHPAMSLVLRLTATPAELDSTCELSIQVRNAHGWPIGDITGRMGVGSPEAPEVRASFHQICDLAPICFPEPDQYAVHVLIDGDDKARVPLAVAHAQRERPPATWVRNRQASGPIFAQTGAAEPSFRSNAQGMQRTGIFNCDPDQAYFWTEEWQAGEREADADIAAGRVRNFASAETLIQSLRELS